jgi:membrane protein
MIWVNVNVILLLLGNELNLAFRKLRIEKLLADELKKDVEEFHQDIPEFLENTDQNTIVLNSDKKQ